MAYKPPLSVNNRNADFTDEYIAGSFTDTSLGAVERRKDIEKQICQGREDRRKECRGRFEKAQKVSRRNRKLAHRIN